MKISIIIPVLNEAENLIRLLPFLKQFGGTDLKEIIAVDGGSKDGSKIIASQFGAIVISASRGRAVQMNAGAQKATGNLLYFVHADVIPPKTFTADILAALENGYETGCYRFRFDSPRLLLRFNSYMTRFDRITFRGGDQTLFVTRKLFDDLGGYSEKHVVMEDYDLILRARKKAKFTIMNGNVLVSARKYDNNSYLRVNLANMVVFGLFFLKVPPVKLDSIYKRMINHPKAV